MACSDYNQKVLEKLDSMAATKMVFFTAFASGVILNIICCRWRRVSIALLYHECLLIFIETAMLGREDFSSVLVISVRFILAVIFLSVEARCSIICVTICCFLTHASMHLVLMRADMIS